MIYIENIVVSQALSSTLHVQDLMRPFQLPRGKLWLLPLLLSFVQGGAGGQAEVVCRPELINTGLPCLLKLKGTFWPKTRLLVVVRPWKSHSNHFGPICSAL